MQAGKVQGCRFQAFHCDLNYSRRPLRTSPQTYRTLNFRVPLQPPCGSALDAIWKRLGDKRERESWRATAACSRVRSPTGLLTSDSVKSCQSRVEIPVAPQPRFQGEHGPLSSTTISQGSTSDASGFPVLQAGLSSACFRCFTAKNSRLLGMKVDVC